MVQAARELVRGYLRRNPSEGVLYSVLAAHLETFLARAEGDGSAPGLPRHVVRELRSYLTCGVLAHGFARFRCFGCGSDDLVAFSCKGRGFCPSCGGRRMAESAAHLVDHVLPWTPVRQWVLSFPWALRYLLARRPALCSAVRRVFLRAVFGFYRDRAASDGARRGRTGAVNRIQRFGSALNLNVHFHAILLDGVYTRTSPLAHPVFHEAPEPTESAHRDGRGARRVDRGPRRGRRRAAIGSFHVRETACRSRGFRISEDAGREIAAPPRRFQSAPRPGR